MINEYSLPVKGVNETSIVSTEQNPVLGFEKIQIDTQIATAKKYPRNIEKFITEVQATIATDPEIAASCGYKLKRRNKEGKDIFIEGPSIRLAEILASAWGNIRIQSFVTEIGKQIRAIANVIDLERNIAVSKEVVRRGTDKTGRLYSEDMQVVSANAAQSIAVRNAITSVVPKVFVNKMYNFSKQVAIGKHVDVTGKWNKYVEWFESKGVSKEALMEWLDIKSEKDITPETIRDIVGLKTAIEDGDTTIQEEFESINTDKTNKDQKKINSAEEKTEEQPSVAVQEQGTEDGKDKTSSDNNSNSLSASTDSSVLASNLRQLMAKDNVKEVYILAYCVANKWITARTTKLEDIPYKRLQYLIDYYDKIKGYFMPPSVNTTVTNNNSSFNF